LLILSGIKIINTLAFYAIELRNIFCWICRVLLYLYFLYLFFSNPLKFCFLKKNFKPYAPVNSRTLVETRRLGNAIVRKFPQATRTTGTVDFFREPLSGLSVRRLSCKIPHTCRTRAHARPLAVHHTYNIYSVVKNKYGVNSRIHTV